MYKTMILLVSNDYKILSHLKKMTRAYDEIRTESSCEEALKTLKRKEYDILIIDEELYDEKNIKIIDENKTKKYITVILGEKYKNKYKDITYSSKLIEKELLVSLIKKTGKKEKKKKSLYNYLIKPITKEDFEKVLSKIFQGLTTPINVEDVVKNIRDSEENLVAHPGNRILGESSCIKRVKKLIGKVAPTDLTVLIVGESGSGKELIAEAIYKNSLRSENPFMAVNCAAISPSLIEAELFGHEKGSFTGANFTKKGIIEEVNEGTLFLDEIGDMDLNSQAKLLRVIENGELKKVGGLETIRVNVRFVAATNKDLAEEVEKGKFRKDLYYRLMNFPLELKPLRERKEDIPILVNYFFRQLREKYDKEDYILSEEALKQLLTYNYPGNIRELKNMIERMIVMSEDGVINADLFYKDSENKNDENSLKFLVENDILTMDKIEKALIIKALNKTNWNKAESAKLLGIGRTTLYDKIKKYCLDDK